jgi:hypothetical protein
VIPKRGNLGGILQNIFDFEDHYSYLIHRLNGKSQTRGTKQKFADCTRIQPAYLSQVLAMKYALSLEQADLANGFLQHTLSESEFFLLLVSRDRAGSESLRKHFTRQIDQILKLRLEVVERLGRKIEISSETQAIYYSSWMYAALHVATTIPSLRTLDAMKTYFDVPAEKILQILHFLETQNLIVKKEGEFHPTQNWIRLDRLSPHTLKLHSNWRQRAIQNLETQKSQDLHYSGVYSLDKKTAASVREILLETISRSVEKIEGAPEKELYSIGVDFFDLKRS